MGMFDRLSIAKNLLPLSDIENAILSDNEDWQTKDLNCQLDEVTITKTGNIAVCHRDYSYNKETNRSTIVNETTTVLLDDLEIAFYTDKRHEGKGYWFEFEAIFKQGKLQRIEKLSGYDNGAMEY